MPGHTRPAPAEMPCDTCPLVPAARKCCFCVPVRRGVIIFGYINLVLSLLWFPLLVFLLVEHATRGAGAGREAGEGVDEAEGEEVPLPPPLLLALCVCAVLLDAAMTVLLLVGAHKKRRALLVVYWWWGAGFQLLTLLVDLLYLDTHHHLLNAIYFLFLCMNVYQLYLVHSCAVRLRERTVRYVQYRPPPAPAPATACAPASAPAC